MNLQILAFLLLFLVGQNSDFIHAQNMESDLENSSAPFDKLRSSSNSKIHPILIQWQLSEKPNEFAKENNLSFTGDKVAVYIYLESEEARSKVPQNIQITAFDEKIAAAFVSAQHLDELNELNFIQKITPPDFVHTSPLPQVELTENQTTDEIHYGYLISIILGGIIIFMLFIIKKRPNLKNQN